METIMPKAKSAIKVIAIVLLMCFHEGIQSQDRAIDGLFCRVYFPSGDFSNCLEFKKNNTFEYEFSGHLGTQSYAHGQYELIKNKLILDYNKTEPIKIGHHVSKIWTNSKDSINLQFNFFDFDNIPIPFVNVIYKDSLSKNGYNGIIATKEGRAQLILKKKNKDFELVISNLGYSQYKFTVDRNYNHDIAVYLQKEGDGLPIRNQIDTIIIDKIRPKYFNVKNKNGSVTTWRKMED
ncbi:hypothetical protein MWU76_11075 [Gelidibacter sp. F2691]|nr:hypothetical protein [Gelidibacter sp. F2691]